MIRNNKKSILVEQKWFSLVGTRKMIENLGIPNSTAFDWIAMVIKRYPLR